MRNYFQISPCPNWARDRVKHSKRCAVTGRLQLEVGTYAPLYCGSILIGLTPDQVPGVVPLEFGHSSIEVMSQSQVYTDLPLKARRRLSKSDFAHYSRIESAWKAFGANLVLSARSVPSDPALAKAMYLLKLWFIRLALWNPDDAIQYLKWLSKSCMSIALGKGPIEGLSSFPGYNAKNRRIHWTPFQGSLEWVNKLFIRPPGFIETQLTMEQYRTMAQLSGISRALPYPSDRQVTKSIHEVAVLIHSEPKIWDEGDRLNYEAGLLRVEQLCNRADISVSHASLAKSASLESSRSKGGRGFYEMQKLKAMSQLEITPEVLGQLVLALDCFGQAVVSVSWLPKLERLNFAFPDGRAITLGDIAYVPEILIEDHLNALIEWKHEVPKYLGNLLALEASMAMLSYGHYEGGVQLELPLGWPPLFRKGTLSGGFARFRPKINSIPVRAAISIESGMKTRLVTSAPAAITTVMQLIRHNVSGWLSRDPLLRVGFFEADKLWEVLKAYRSQNSVRGDDSWMLSTDLKEATYHMPFSVMDSNIHFLRRVLAGHPSLEVYLDLLMIHSRSIDFSDIVQKGYISADQASTWSLPTRRGSFMGDSLSFMHLTLALASCSWQAAFVAYTKKPIKQIRFYEGYIKRPLGQIVGDDNLAIAAPLVYCETFRHCLDVLSLQISKIDATSKYFGVFCEQAFCFPTDWDSAELAGYHKDSKFGDLFFLDIFKGSSLSTQAKVKTEGSDPLIGHLKLVAKQARWHPVEQLRRIVPVVAWAINWPKSARIGDVKPWFPEIIGGLDIALGTTQDLDDPALREHYASYLSGMLTLDQSTFFEKWSILRSITRGAPKGVPWDPQSIDLALLVSKLRPVDEASTRSSIPEYIRKAGYSAQLSYMSEQLGVIPIRQLDELLEELSMMKKFWEGVKPDPRPIVLTTRGLRKRFTTAWSQIRSTVPQIEVQQGTFLQLCEEIGKRTWGLFFDKKDPAIEEFFNGMTELTVRWRRRDEQ